MVVTNLEIADRIVWEEEASMEAEDSEEAAAEVSVEEEAAVPVEGGGDAEESAGA